MAVTPPVLQASYSSPYNLGTQPQSVSVTVAVGDVLAFLGTSETQITWAAPTSTPSLTWTLAQNVTVASYSGSVIYTATVGAGQAGSYSISCNPTNASAFHWGFTIERWSGSGGVGTSAKTNVASGAPSLALTCAANSAVSCVNGDFAALSGTRTWRTINGITPTSGSGELVYVQDGGAYTAYVAQWSDVGTAGSKTVGLTAPTGQKYAICAVEILGSTSGALAATASNATSALTGTSKTTGTLASQDAVATSALAGSASTSGALASVSSAATSALVGTSKTTGALAAQAASGTSAFTGVSQTSGALVSGASSATSVLVGSSKTSGALVAQDAVATSTLVGSSQTSGTLALVSGSASAQLTGSARTTGSLAAQSSSGSGALAGSSSTSGALVAQAAAETAQLVGAQQVTGSLGSIAAGAQGSLTGTSASSGALAALGSNASASLVGAQAAQADLTAVTSQVVAEFHGVDAGAPITGTLNAVATAVTSQFSGQTQTSGSLVAVAPLANLALSGAQSNSGALTAVSQAAQVVLVGNQVLSSITGVLVATGKPAEALLTGVTDNPIAPTGPRVYRVPADLRRSDVSPDHRRFSVESDVRVSAVL
jgi:hypothetical protein